MPDPVNPHKDHAMKSVVLSNHDTVKINTKARIRHVFVVSISGERSYTPVSVHNEYSQAMLFIQQAKIPLYRVKIESLPSINNL
jgi:hypothetical protein